MRSFKQQVTKHGGLFLGVCLLLSLAPASSAFAGAAQAVATPAPAGGWTAPDPTYGVGIDASVPIRMDDGVDLVGDVQYPVHKKTGARAQGPFPVLLTQNPYNCEVPNGAPTPVGALQNVAPADYFVPRGYIFATVCVRGTGRSGGEFAFWQTREAEDAPRLAEWAVNLPSSNGKLGLTGCSYLGMTQWAAAAGSKAVSAMAPMCMGVEQYRDAFMGDGMPNQSAVKYALAAPFILGPRAAAPMAELSADMLRGGPAAYDGKFWKERRRESALPAIVRNRVPALMLSGYDDLWTGGALEAWTQLQNLYFGRPQFSPMRPGQKVTGRYQVIIGPWEHGAGIDHALLMRWFDTWLRDVPTGIQDVRSSIHIFDRTSGKWVDMSSYPGTDRYTKMHLGADNSLTSAVDKKQGTTSLVWTQPEVTDGSVSFTSAPTTNGFGLAGPVSATLYAASSNKSLELIATLQNVAPDGHVTELTSGYVIGSLRARDRDRSWYDRAGTAMRPWCECTEDDWLTPGKVARMEVRLKPVVATIEPGHALRMVLTTQTPTFKCYGPHDPARPVTFLIEDDPCFPTRTQHRTLPGTYTVSFGGGTPSALNLPTVPYHAFPYRDTSPVPAPWSPIDRQVFREAAHRFGAEEG